MILGAIEQDIPVHELIHLAQLEGGDLEVLEAQIQEGSPAVGRQRQDIQLPVGASVPVLIRNEVAQPILPDTVFQMGDKVIAIAGVEDESELKRQLIGDAPIENEG
jgi:trk system potassium uptake protein